VTVSFTNKTGQIILTYPLTLLAPGRVTDVSTNPPVKQNLFHVFESINQCLFLTRSEETITHRHHTAHEFKSVIGSFDQAYNEVPILSGESAWIIPLLVIGAPIMEINYQASE